MSTVQFERTGPPRSTVRPQRQANGEEAQILFAAQQMLRSRAHLDQDHCSLQLRDGRLTIRGRVPSFYQKQMAQELVRKVNGVRLVTNLLHVGSE